MKQYSVVLCMGPITPWNRKTSFKLKFDVRFLNKQSNTTIVHSKQISKFKITIFQASGKLFDFLQHRIYNIHT